MEEYIKKKSAILIQARTTSRRLPKKVLLPLTLENQTKSVIEWIYQRLKKTPLPLIFFVIPEEDILLENFLKERNIPFFKGPLEDVRKRYILAAKELNIDIIVRATADNPFVEPELVLPTLEILIKNSLDLFSFIGLPIGVSIEAFTLDALIKGEEYGELIYKEHVSLHIKKNLDIFKVFHQEYLPFLEYYQQKLNQVKNKNNFNFMPRLTLDEKEDYEVFKKVYRRLKKDFTIFDVIDLYFDEPELFKGNINVKQRQF